MQSNQYLTPPKAILLITLVLLLMVFGIWVWQAGRVESFRFFTQEHTVFGDIFFRYITHAGDGIFILALAALLAILKRTYLSVGIVGGYLLSGIFAQIGKRLLNAPRPKAFFEALGEKVYEVPGVEVHLAGSFPSGHTASVFALAVFLMLAIPSRWLGILLLLMACTVGFSRVYLSQHFPVDVWAGACIGSVCGVVTYMFLQKKLKGATLH
jgi:membrane-associated phospholipid phosphatase